MKQIIYTAIAMSVIAGLYARTNSHSTVAVKFRQVDDAIIATVSVPEPIATASAIIPQALALEPETPQTEPNIEKIRDFIHLAESTRGTNTNPNALHNYCKAQGKSNEYGYGGMKMKICFNSHEEATARVVRWINEHLEKYDGDIAKTLCWYNLGEEQVNCKYYQNYLNYESNTN